MRITMKVMDRILFSVVVLFFLAPLTVFAANKVVVIPLFQDAPAKPLKNIIFVSPANGHFTDPVAAVNSITDASATNPYLVVIGPGVYTVTQTLVMKPYVDITGRGENVTKITGAISTGSTSIIDGADNSTLSSLTVENTGGGSYSTALSNSYPFNSTGVTNVTAMASGGTIRNCGVYHYHSSPKMTNVTATASGGTGTYNYGVYNYSPRPTWSSSPTMIGVIATASGGTRSCGIHNDYSHPSMTGVTATASGGTDNYCVYNNFSNPTMRNVTATASAGTNNYGVYNSYSVPMMTDITATASGGTNNYGVYNAASSPTMAYVTATGSGGSYNYGVYNAYLAPGYSAPVIRRSTLDGSTDGLYTGTGCTATVSQSTIIGGVGGTGTSTCVACDNGSGTALGADCLVP